MDIKKANLYVVSAFCAVILAIIIALNVVAVMFSGLLEVYLGTIGASGRGSFESDYETDAELLQVEQDTAIQIAEEGTVLLKNDDGLPLAANAKVTLFSQNSVNWMGGATSGSDQASSWDNRKSALEAEKIAVNPTVWDYYSNTGKARDTYKLNETDWATVSAATSSSFASYNDAAIAVFSRFNTEGSDQPADMSRYGGSADEIYMQLSSVELDLLKGIRDAGFKKTIVILNTNCQMQVDFLKGDPYGVDACVLCGATGNTGITGLVRVLSGKANPSGHLVDTYVYDNRSTPAAQNLGDNRFLNANGEVSKYSYINYVEGIYIGYRYYETRYEDVVMGTENAGDYNYTDTVAYPFGYGLGYTQFTWSDFKATVTDGTVNVSLKVENTGSVDGKDAVGVYIQSPYTEYDKKNQVEKASVTLAAFAKTPMIKAGQSETVSISFDAEEAMKSYDYTAAKGYILEEGDYYITAAQDAHQAVNNILLAKGYNDIAEAGGGTPSADKNFVYRYNIGTFKNIAKDSVTDHTVTNRFDYATAEGTTYLTRSNWIMMDNNGLDYSTGTATEKSPSSYSEVIKTHEMWDGLRENLAATGWEAAGRPASADNNEAAIVGQDAGLKLKDLVGKDYGDPMWMTLIQQLKVSEIHGLWNLAGWRIGAVDAIEMPGTTCNDGPTGLGNFVNGWSSFRWPCETLIASTWNVELAEKMAALVAEDGLRTDVTGWYAPAMNLHRTCFGGRAGEYYSEDPLLSGSMGAAECIGAESKGMIVFIKHFAINEQDTNRGTVSMWCNEQAMRELYFKPFEISVKTGKANGVMDSQTRIGYRYCKGNYQLLTEVLREEWGFQGVVVTDYTSDGGLTGEMCLAGGTDLMLSGTALKLPDTSLAKVRNALQESAHRTAYVVGNSNLMVGLLGNEAYSAGIPVYIILMIVVDVVGVLAIAAVETYTVIRFVKSRKEKPEEAEA